MDPDLCDLIAGWSGQELPPERCAQLLDRLAADPAFREAFAEEVRTLTMLRVVQAGIPRWLQLSDELGWAEPAGGSDAPSPALLDRLAREPPLQPQRQWRPRLWGMIAAAVATGILAAAAVRWQAGRAVADPWPEPVRPVAVAPSAGLAVIVHTSGAVWEPGGPAPTDAAVLPATRLKLRTGSAVLAFFGGSILALEGPADLEIFPHKQVFLRQGRARVRVPHGVEGLAVLVPGAAVVDLGTEFGLTVDPDGVSHVAVFAGLVDVLLRPNGTQAFPKRQVGVGDAVMINPSTPTIAPEQLQPARFAAPIEVPRPPLQLPAGYAANIQSARPWGYWQFGAARGREVPNVVPGGAPLRAYGPVGLPGERGGGVAVFGAATDTNQYLAVDRPWAPPCNPGFAVELWAMPEVLSAQTLAALVAQQGGSNEPHFGLIEISGLRSVWLCPPGTIRFLYRSPPGGQGGIDLFSDRVCVPYRWHHVVAQRVGDEAELYLDGRLCERAAVGPGNSPECRLMLGRLKRQESPDRRQTRPFIGHLGDVAVYNRPLTPDEVRQHAGQPP